MRLLVTFLGVVVLAVPGAGSAVPSAPPPGLTANGRLVWQLDALVRDQIGGAACVIYKNTSIVPAAQCKQLPLSDAGAYVPAFRSARGSTLRVIDVQSISLGNVVPVLVRGHYVQCSPGYYLVLQRRGGLQGLILGCVTRF